MNQPFLIFALDLAGVEKIKSAPPEPHQHDYEELIVGAEGKVLHFIDFQTSEISAPFVSFVTRGKVHRVLPEAENGRCAMWVIRFKSEFLAETTFQLYSRYHNVANIPAQDGPLFSRMTGICQLMAAEMAEETPDLAVLRHLLAALFSMMESLRRKNQPDAAGLSAQNTTFHNFLAILEANFRRPEGVEFYAEKLFMSARNLNLICRQVLNMSVSEIIETRKLLEAKNLLSSTDKTISEIGFELGYSEKSYFTSVFRKKAGQTPSEFRDEMRRQNA